MSTGWEFTVSRARAALGPGGHQPFDDLTTSVLLKYLLLGRLEHQGPSVASFRGLPPGRRKECLGRIAELAAREVHPAFAELRRGMTGDPRFRLEPSHLKVAADDGVYLGRVAQLALEQYLGERAAPEVCVAPVPLSDLELSECLPGTVDYVVVFEGFPNFTNELYPLAVDAYEADLATVGSAAINVIGAHVSWWREEGGLRRGLFLRHRDHMLLESAWARPRRPAVIHCLCMGSERHQQVSDRARKEGITEANPYAPFCRAADSKSECFRFWSQKAVPTPPAILLPRQMGSSAALEALEAAVARWNRERPGVGVVVQPDHGTEGAGVTCLPPGTKHQEIARAVGRIWESDDALVRPEVRGLRYRGIPPAPVRKDEIPPTPLTKGGSVVPSPPPGGKGLGEGVACDLRVNVSWDGGKWEAESGYLQVSGRPGDPITSPGRGGRIIKFSRGALHSLMHQSGSDSVPVSLTRQDWERIQQLAVAAASALPGHAAVVGVDLRLAPTGGASAPRIEARVLDVNPRPAGLAHSEFLPLEGKAPEPGVSRRLWKQFRSVSDGD